MRVLVLEDEATLQQQLRMNLAKQGYSVDTYSDGKEGRYALSEYDYDVAIVDIGLPELTGIDVIRQIRSAGKNTPIIILTARGSWAEKVEGLEAGADDYLVKPFHMPELLARINALLRRSAGFSSPVIKAGPLTLNTSRQEVSINDISLELTTYEYKVLEYFMLHPGEVISKTQLTEHIYDQNSDRDSNVIEVFVGRLRKKIDAHMNSTDTHFNPIETLRGRGYRFGVTRL